MTGIETLFVVLLGVPAAVGLTAKLIEVFCEVRTGSVAVLGACLGGTIALQPAVCLRIAGAIASAGSSESAVIFFSAKLSLLCGMIFCTVALSVVAIEVPSRWLLERGRIREALPWQFIRTLCIIIVLSGAGSWILDLVEHSI